MKSNLAVTGLLFLIWGAPGCFPQEQPKVVPQQKPISFMDAMSAPPTDQADQVHPDDVHITEAQMKEFGIVVKVAAAATLSLEFQLPGEIVANADQLVHMVPSVPGIVREVKKRIGDQVSAGEVLAILDSRELAAAKSKYLASSARVGLAQATLVREQNLWDKMIGSEQEYLEAKTAFEETSIALRDAKQALHAIGLSESDVQKLPDEPDTELTRFEMRAPLAGEVIERHLVRGELLKEDSQAFVLANLDTVWVNLAVYQKYLPSVQIGQTVRVFPGNGVKEQTGTITYLSPIIDEQTRTATARVVLDNDDGQLRPGLFVSAVILTGELAVPVAIPKTAITEIEGKKHIFIKSAHGFAPREIRTGRSDGVLVEITEGLSADEGYASEGVFSLKSELLKEDFGSGHGHAH